MIVVSIRACASVPVRSLTTSVHVRCPTVPAALADWIRSVLCSAMRFLSICLLSACVWLLCASTHSLAVAGESVGVRVPVHYTPAVLLHTQADARTASQGAALVEVRTCAASAARHSTMQHHDATGLCRCADTYREQFAHCHNSVCLSLIC